LHTEYKYETRNDSGYGDSATNAFEFVGYLGLRWRLIAAACICAVVLSLGASLAIPKRYTATASIVIEPPAGNDVRTATAVSPIYLESLRTYERFADSDTLFAGAVERFHLASGRDSSAIESLKQQVLKVTKLRDTKILEISATLPEPALAQQLVSYVAEETVKLSRGESVAVDREVMDAADRQASEAMQKLHLAQQNAAENAVRQPSGELQAQIEADVDLSEKVRQSLIEVRGYIAEYQQKPDFARELPGLQARAAELARQSAELEKEIAEKTILASRRIADWQTSDQELKMAQAAAESSAAGLRELRATAGTRGERLRVIDPGIVPQRPSSPNVALNVLAALLLTVVMLTTYLAISFSYARRSR